MDSLGDEIAAEIIADKIMEGWLNETYLPLSCEPMIEKPKVFNRKGFFLNLFLFVLQHYQGIPLLVHQYPLINLEFLLQTNHK
jgi:hypothetical protein